MNITRLFRLFTDLLGRTPLHPQYFSKHFLSRQIQCRAKQFDGLLVDLGCGLAPYKKFFTHTRYFGLDYPVTSPSSRARHIDAFVDLTGLALKNSRVDGALCTQVLEHISSPEKAVSEIARILKPGGKLLLTAPFFYPLHDEPYDFYRFTPYGLEKLLSAAGLKVIEIVPQGGFLALSGEMFNLFCMHKIQNLLSSAPLQKILGFCMIPAVLAVAFLVNVICIIFGPLDNERRFVMNFLVFGEKGI